MKLNIKGKDIEVNEDKLIELIKREGLEVKSGEFEVGDALWYLNESGITYRRVYKICEQPYHTDCLCTKIALGNAYHTENEAIQARDRQLAITRLWNWAKENAPFELYWNADLRYKYYSTYNYISKSIRYEACQRIQQQTELPYFATSDDVERFNSECREDLLKVFNVK